MPVCMACLRVELLKTKLGAKCPRIIRVYSEMLENQVFPIPRESLQAGGSTRGRRYEMIDKDDAQDICLHHLVRQPIKKFSKKIREFDKLFKANRDTPENVTDKQVWLCISMLLCYYVVALRLQAAVCFAPVSACFGQPLLT